LVKKGEIKRLVCHTFCNKKINLDVYEFILPRGALLDWFGTFIYPGKMVRFLEYFFSFDFRFFFLSIEGCFKVKNEFKVFFMMFIRVFQVKNGFFGF